MDHRPRHPRDTSRAAAAARQPPATLQRFAFAAATVLALAGCGRMARTVFDVLSRGR